MELVQIKINYFMSLKLYLKERLFKILDLLTEKQGSYLYHKIQDAVNGENMLLRVKSNYGSYKLFQKILQKNGLSIKDKNIIEIGSGWAPIFPYFLLYFGGARLVMTYDLNEHFSKKNIDRLNEIFHFEYDVKPIVEKYGSYSLPKSVVYYPETNVIDANLPEADLVFSRFVLEHVTPGDIELMHKKFKKELRKGSTIVHFISPSDHRAYVDPNLSLQDFLQYSEYEWRKKQTRFDYHNRLRLPQFLAIFKAAGMEVVDLQYDSAHPDSSAYLKFKKVRVHEDFKVFSDEQLTAGSINVILKT